MIALITGASSGIGQATARLLARHHIDLILTGRRQERLRELQEELSPLVRIHTLHFDVRDVNAVDHAIRSIPESFQSVDILINNAGNAHGLAPIEQASIEDSDAMIDINVKGLLYVSKAIIPGMIKRKRGHIINVGSIAGKEAYPNGAVYCASKHAVDALTQGMRHDLLPHGIKVAAIHPGAVNTEFSLVRFKGDQAKADAVYRGFEPLVAHDIADAILFMITRPAHVNIADMLILPSAQASATHIQRQ